MQVEQQPLQGLVERVVERGRRDQVGRRLAREPGQLALQRRGAVVGRLQPVVAGGQQQPDRLPGVGVRAAVGVASVQRAGFVRRCGCHDPRDRHQRACARSGEPEQLAPSCNMMYPSHDPF